jgi:hypothetical protein
LIQLTELGTLILDEVVQFSGQALVVNFFKHRQKQFSSWLQVCVEQLPSGLLDA